MDVLVSVDSNIQTLYGDIETVENDLLQYVQDRSDADSTLYNTFSLLNDNVKIEDGIIFIKDATRAKWLSNRERLTYTKTANAANSYLKCGDVVSNESSEIFSRDYVLCGIAVHCKNTSSAVIHIRNHDSQTDIVTYNMNNDTVYINNDIDLSFSVNDRLTVYCTGTIEDPVVSLHVAINGGAVI
jgi:hypothetical protein